YRPEALSLAPSANAIGYYARTSLDEPSENGSTVVWFDQVSGAQLGFGKPYGSTAADAIDKTVRVLHTADGLGWPYRVFVSLFGLLTAGMAIAGVVLWVRRSRRLPNVVPALSRWFCFLFRRFGCSVCSPLPRMPRMSGVHRRTGGGWRSPSSLSCRSPCG